MTPLKRLELHRGIKGSYLINSSILVSRPSVKKLKLMNDNNYRQLDKLAINFSANELSSRENWNNLL